MIFPCIIIHVCQTNGFVLPCDNIVHVSCIVSSQVMNILSGAPAVILSRHPMLVAVFVIANCVIIIHIINFYSQRMNT